LGPVEVQGVEDLHCQEVTGHTMWRGLIGKYLEECKARDIIRNAVQLHVQKAENQEKKNPEGSSFD